MDDLREGLAAAVEGKEAQIIDNGSNGEQTAETEPQLSTAQASGSGEPAPVKTDGQAATAQEILDWRKDERFGKMWKTDNDVYKSYRELEKVYQPLKEKHTQFQKMLEELQVQPDKLPDIVKGWNEYQDPNNPFKQKAGYFDTWLGNPLYQQKVVDFFTSLERAEDQRKYGNLPDEVIAKIKETEEKANKLEEVFKKQEEEKLVQTFDAQINDSLKQCKEYAESRGFTFTDEIAAALRQIAVKDQVWPKDLPFKFMQMYQKELDKSYSEKHEAEILKRLNKTGSATIPTVTGKAAPATTSPEGGLRAGLQNFLRGNGLSKS